MKIRSRGLGRRELEMDLREFTVERDGTGVLMKGVTHAPITWETTVWMGPRDVGPVLRMGLHLAMLRLGLAWVLGRPDVPGDDRAGQRMGRVPEGAPREPGAEPAARSVRAAVPAGTAAPAADGTGGGDGTAGTPAADGDTRGKTRPARLQRVERAPRPPTPPRAPRPHHAEQGDRPDRTDRADRLGEPAGRPVLTGGSVTAASHTGPDGKEG